MPIPACSCAAIATARSRPFAIIDSSFCIRIWTSGTPARSPSIAQHDQAKARVLVETARIAGHECTAQDLGVESAGVGGGAFDNEQRGAGVGQLTRAHPKVQPHGGCRRTVLQGLHVDVR